MKLGVKLFGVCTLLLVAWCIGGAAGLIARPHIPPRGWNSWDSFGVSNRTETLAIASALKEHLLDHGYEYVVCVRAKEREREREKERERERKRETERETWRDIERGRER